MLLLSQEPGAKHSYPKVVYSGKDGLSSQALQVSFEELCITVPDLVHAILLMMAMFWTFNVEYTPAAKNTLATLANFIGVKHTKLVTTALKRSVHCNAHVFCECTFYLS